MKSLTNIFDGVICPGKIIFQNILTTGKFLVNTNSDGKIFKNKTMSDKEYRVPLNGGLFHTVKVQYSKETHALLKQLIEESKLSIKQRQSLRESIKNGEPLPFPQSKTCNGKHHKKEEYLVPPSFPKRRSLDAILQSGAYERDKFSTHYNNKGNSHTEKIRLQNMMTYGKEVPQEFLDINLRRNRKLKEKEEEINLDETFDYLLEGVKERIAFLKEMELLGEAKAYTTIIEQEIACKLHQMEQISPELCKQLGVRDEVKNMKNKIL